MDHHCATHPTRPAQSLCHSCGRYFCSECLVEGEEFYYCRDQACQNGLLGEATRVAVEREEESLKAGFFKRVVNLYVDTFVILVVTFPVSQTISPFEHQAIFISILVFAWFVYYFAFEYYFQRTPAKYVTRTVVRSVDGSRPTSVQVLARTLSRLIPVDPYLWRDRRCLHDRISGTRVFNVKSQLAKEM